MGWTEVMITAPKRDSPWNQADVARFLDGANTYSSRLVVTATRLDERKIWRTATGSNLTAQPGDWLLCDGNDNWTVAADVFRATYRNLGGDQYAKFTIVRARQLSSRTTINTLEGPSLAEPGDWLVGNPGGDAWPVPRADFGRRYEKVE